MTAQSEHDDMFLSLQLPRPKRLVDRACNGMCRLWCGNYSLRSCERSTALKDAVLTVRPRLHEIPVVHCAHYRRGAVIPQPASMDLIGRELVAQGIHLDLWGDARV